MTERKYSQATKEAIDYFWKQIEKDIHRALFGETNVETETNDPPVTFGQKEIDALLKWSEEQHRKAPIRASEAIPDDAEWMLMFDGKIRMGKNKWQEYGSIERLGEDAAAKWLVSHKFLTLKEFSEALRRAAQ